MSKEGPTRLKGVAMSLLLGTMDQRVFLV